MAHPAAEVELWAEDEARLGLKPVLRRVWAARGRKKRPLALVRQRYEWMYVYGFVHPVTGRSEWWLLPTVSTEAMSAVLQEFAKLTGAGPQKQIVLLIDGAGWHTSKNLQVPEGLHLHYLPAYSPELQPAERLWPPLRESVANESFETLSLLEERLQCRCRQLSSQRAYLRQLTHYHWWPQ